VNASSEKKVYQPGIAVRLVCWFGIYLLSFLFLIWCWPGEIYDWASPISIPEGLIWLSFGLLGSGLEKYHEVLLPFVYGLYLIHLVLFLALRSKKAFRILLAVWQHCHRYL
jgi:hypothetical protein